MPTETALEIRLKGTPVWRGVLVPSTIKLPKFHAVIQSSMGWTNAHLHFFRTKFGTYEPESEEGDSWSDSMNEAEVTLDQLVGKKQLSNNVDMCFRSQGEHMCALVLGAIKALGF